MMNAGLFPTFKLCIIMKNFDKQHSENNKMTNEASKKIIIDDLAIPLVRYLAKRVPINEDANDLAQEALLRMHKFQKSHDLSNAQAFLYKTANNLLVDQLRRAKVHDKYLTLEKQAKQSDDYSNIGAPSVERTVSAEQELANINKALEQLPNKVRQAFLMSRGRDLSYAEIANEMSVSMSMVEKYIVQALKVLRKEVQ